MTKYMLFVFALILPFAAPAHAESLSVGGRDRSYTVFRPAGLDRAAPAALVIVLHGGFGTGAQAEQSYHWDDKATAKGFVVAYPDGYRRSWNAGGGCCGKAFAENLDDVAFLTALIGAVSRDQNIDPRRVYLTGISNGGAISYRYACEGSFRVAAIGSVSGAMPLNCAAPHPVSVMEIHGLQDRNIPFAGGVGTKGVTPIAWPAAEATLDKFRRADQCAAFDTRHDGVLTTQTSLCEAGRSVTLITIADAGHQWPGGEPAKKLATLLLDLDTPSTAMNATDRLWQFFQDHPAPP